jgi:hypothetical protein
VVVGLVLAIGTPSGPKEYGNGQVRSYATEPEEMWSLDLTTMQTYGEGATPEVTDTFGDIWLVAYPSGLGTTYLAIDRRNGKQLWKTPIDAGLGACAINDRGGLGCALNLAEQPNGFYVADLTTGELREFSADNGTRAMAGVGPDFLRVNNSGYQVTRNTPDGEQVWARSFAAAASIEVDDDLVAISASDGSKHIIDPTTGADKVSCASCDLRVYPTGFALQFTDDESPRVEFYTRGGVRTSVNEAQQLVSGPSTLAVTTGSGPAQIMQTQGAYSVFDPAQKNKLWQVTDPELSKVAARPCGSVVAFARKDGSRSILDLATGDKVGGLARPDPKKPGTNLDYLSCVGQGSDTAVFGTAGELTAFTIADGSVAWQRSIVGGQAVVVDGYLVLEEGTTLSVLAPS